MRIGKATVDLSLNTGPFKESLRRLEKRLSGLAPAPRLMLRTHKLLSMAVYERVRSEMEKAPVMIIEGGIDIAQLVDGRWVPIFPEKPAEE
jgi:hypothetical protein